MANGSPTTAAPAASHPDHGGEVLLVGGLAGAALLAYLLLHKSAAPAPGSQPLPTPVPCPPNWANKGAFCCPTGWAASADGTHCVDPLPPGPTNCPPLSGCDDYLWRARIMLDSLHHGTWPYADVNQTALMIQAVGYTRTLDFLQEVDALTP